MWGHALTIMSPERWLEKASSRSPKRETLPEEERIAPQVVLWLQHTHCYIRACVPAHTGKQTHSCAHKLVHTK